LIFRLELEGRIKEGENLTQRREDAKIKTWRLGGFSEAGVRIHMG